MLSRYEVVLLQVFSKVLVGCLLWLEDKISDRPVVAVSIRILPYLYWLRLFRGV